MQAGFNFGLLYALVLRWAVRQVDAAHTVDGRPINAPAEPQPTGGGRAWPKTGLMAFGGSALVIAAGYEHFFWTGLAVALFYALALGYATGSVDLTEPSNQADDRRWSVSLAFAAFLLVFRLCQGVTSRAGVVLELYDAKAVDQYAWPPARVALFAPAAIALVIATLYAMRRMLRAPRSLPGMTTLLPERMVDLLTFIGVVGAVSIWPSKIGVLYAVCLFFAVFALNRLNRHFDDIDSQR